MAQKSLDFQTGSYTGINSCRYEIGDPLSIKVDLAFGVFDF
jgi:hypothetical protein